MSVIYKMIKPQYSTQLRNNIIILELESQQINKEGVSVKNNSNGMRINMNNRRGGGEGGLPFEKSRRVGVRGIAKDVVVGKQMLLRLHGNKIHNRGNIIQITITLSQILCKIIQNNILSVRESNERWQLCYGTKLTDQRKVQVDQVSFSWGQQAMIKISPCTVL